ncbi:glycosyl transferase group 1 [Methylobacterium sp. 4-46]|uniref:glycosyltransferase family 4 protein n=1 Tax=unclassified Methylobacterium TaxID=2615210 RepID=UPI000152D906|nr:MULTISPECIES: glycosyltransferase family 4 protein [Methylobacterium]ACA18385.1 glycosyl transferase group 1 [Methylobacterium sp. 4-46]WFT77676.1 glycosyltransferase family 4 protein [Methylobacterium nodulans]
MRVAVYYPWVYLRSGIERALIEIKRRSRHEIRIYTNHFDPRGTFPELDGMGVTELSRVSVERTYSAVTAAALSIVRTRLDPAEHDAVLVCCDGLGPLLTFANRRKPVVNLCFTPLRATYDEVYRDRLLARGGPARPVKRAAETVFRLVDRMAWRNFDEVICIADTVRRRVADNRLFPESKIHLAYPGVEPRLAVPEGASEPMFLLPGRIMWTKNIELAIDGFRQFLSDAPPALQRFRLHIAGMVDAKSRPYFAQLQELAGGDERIVFETVVSDERMRALYTQAWAVLAPAFNEDFGLTPVEAMAHGRPVLACNRGGLRETVLDGVTGLLVEPEPAAFAAGLRRIAQDADLARQLGAQGPARAAAFTWPRFVQTIDAVLDGAQRRSV